MQSGKCLVGDENLLNCIQGYYYFGLTYLLFLICCRHPKRYCGGDSFLAKAFSPPTSLSWGNSVALPTPTLPHRTALIPTQSRVHCWRCAVYKQLWFRIPNCWGDRKLRIHTRCPLHNTVSEPDYLPYHQLLTIVLTVLTRTHRNCVLRVPWEVFPQKVVITRQSPLLWPPKASRRRLNNCTRSPTEWNCSRRRRIPAR